MLESWDTRFGRWPFGAKKAFVAERRASAGADGLRGRLARTGIAGAGMIVAASLLPWRPGIVEGHSMEPTLPPGCLFVYARRTFQTRPLRRGDIIVLQVHGVPWVKRVFATGGESFWALHRA